MDRNLIVRPMRTGDELAPRTAPDVGGKDFVWVVKNREDDVEPAKKLLQFRVQDAALSEESRQGSSLDGAHRFCQSANLSQLGNMAIPQHLQAGRGKLRPQRRQHRQGENKIPDGAAANDQNSSRFWPGISR